VTKVREKREQLFFLAVILVVTVIAYGPLVGGVWGLSLQTTQAVNAFILLGVAFLDALFSVLKVQSFRPDINSHGLLLFGMSCLALVASSLSGIWPLALLGLCLNVGALLSFCFGRSGVRMFYPALAGFGVIVTMLVLVPQVDRWLRLMSGTVSSWVLPVLGIRSDLVVQQDPFQVILVAEKGAGVFNVATECNGMGILMSSLALALILLPRRRRSWPGVVLLLLGAAGVGLLFNTIRIIGIATATLKTDISYPLIHEGLGSMIYLLALGGVYGMSLLTGSPVPCCPGPAVPCTERGA